MWVCPKCGRAFKRTNQGHYCGKAPDTVEAYIAAQPAQARAHLAGIAQILRRSVPDARERILWSMPYYERGAESLSFSAGKTRLSFYAGAEAVERFAPALRGFETRKNAVYFPYDRPLPAELIEAIAKWCLCGEEPPDGEAEEQGAPD